MADRRLCDRLATMRARTTLSACAVVGLALLVGAVGVVVVLRRSLVGNIDGAARSRAADVAALATQGRLPPILAVPGNEDALVQVVDHSGHVVAASANLQGQGPITRAVPSGVRAMTQTLRRAPEKDRREEFRVVALRASAPGGPVTVYVASTLEVADQSISAVRSILLVGLPALLGVVGLTTWLIVGRALRPVDAIRSEVADISAGALDRRVPELGADDEIGRLAQTMNAMLDRLQSAADRQRRFVGEASHEMQSPLAASRAELEVAIAHPGLTNWASLASSLLEENERMERLVHNLLFLARADELVADGRPLSRVDVDDLVLLEVDRLRGRDGITIDASAVSAAEVLGRADDLGRVVRNLLENAHRYARSSVRVALRTAGAEVELSVADDGPGVPPADRERIFDRFTRLDEARSRDTGGSGLGLAIAKGTVTAHGGRIWTEDGRPGARFVVRLPAPP